MKKKILALLGVLFVTLACILSSPAAPAQPGVGTIVAATMQALTPSSNAVVPTQVTPAEPLPAQATQPSGIAISFENISVTIPNGLASGAAGEKVPTVSPDTGAPWDIGPAYIKFTLSAYTLQGTMWHPEIRIYPAEEFRQMEPSAGDLINELKSITSNPSGSLPQYLPFLPSVNAGQVFYAQMKMVNFKNGSGIRYVTQFDQAPIPINNQEMFYTFQGLSQDGKYYVAVTLPVNTAFLPTDGSQNSPTPAGGVPMDWNKFENFPIYLNNVKQKISSTDPNSFNPILSTLDALIQSIDIKQ